MLLMQAFAPKMVAQEKTFVREYFYKASETDSKVSSRQKALTQVKAFLVEELGTYVESYVNYTVTEENDVITKDFFTNEIKTLSAGTTQTIILEERWDGYEYYVKASIVADPEEIVQRINQTLSVRKSSEAIDSLKILLNSTDKELKLKNNELDLLKVQLATQQKEINATQVTLASLNKQLAESKLQLSTYQAEEASILSEIEQIEQTIKSKTNSAVSNVRIGMTPSEVVRVCGKPRAVDACTDNFNYGSVWVIFESDIVVALIDARDFQKCGSKGTYEIQDVKFILK